MYLDGSRIYTCLGAYTSYVLHGHSQIVLVTSNESKKNQYLKKKKSLGNGEGKLKRKMKNTPKREPSTLEAAEMQSADMHLLTIKQIW